jgi:hypothetical protein
MNSERAKDEWLHASPVFRYTIHPLAFLSFASFADKFPVVSDIGMDGRDGHGR